MKNKYEIRGDVTEVLIQKKGMQYVFLIDTEDVPLVSQFGTTWSVNSIDPRYIYAITRYYSNSVRKHVLMHRVIVQCPDGMYVDHINHNTLDNRKSNLRIVTKRENSHNLAGARRDNKSSGERGVHFNKQTRKWMAHINFNSNNYYLGSFDEKEYAIDAVGKAINIIDDNESVEQKLDDMKPSQDVPRSINKASGVRNVYWNKEYATWYVQIQVNKKLHYFGSFKDFDEAKKVAEHARSTKHLLS